MVQNEPNQACPFCNASWGTCEHYRILAEWEAEAAAVEAMARRARRRRGEAAGKSGESDPAIRPEP